MLILFSRKHKHIHAFSIIFTTVRLQSIFFLWKTTIRLSYTNIMVTHCLGLGHETMVCAVCFFIFLWICDMAGLLHGTFMSWWYLPQIWPSVTDMQHCYHARYPTDDWRLAYMFSQVYFSVKVCLVGMFPHSVAHGKIPASGSMYPSRWLPLFHEKTKSNKGWPGFLLEPSEGAFKLTYGSACIIGWKSGFLDISVSPYIAQCMWCVIGRIHYGLRVVFYLRHFTASHYHDDARLLTGVEDI